MRPPDRPSSRAIDWRGWVALAWAVVFGALYAAMLLERRAPGLTRALRSFGRHWLGRGAA